MPKASLVTLSVSAITHFLADGRFITSMPRSVAYFKALKVLPVDLPVRPWPVAIVTLKNRTVSPVVQLFIEQVRAVAKTMFAPLVPGENTRGKADRAPLDG